MIINKVTFTGIDDKTNIKKLQEIQKEFPYVEWGVLIASSPGQGRQPSEDYIESLKDTKLNLALHICSGHSRSIMTDGNLELKYDFFKRNQINFNFKHTKHDLVNYTNLVNKYKDKSFILQSNFSNEIFIDKIISTGKNTNTHILYDSSGGRGTEIKNIKPPYKGIYTGYSGGIGPENINEICKAITFHKADDRVWIDMETAVRTDNIFDLDKVYKVLKIVDKHINKGFKL